MASAESRLQTNVEKATIDLHNPSENVTISDVMTQDEIIARISIDNGIPLSQAREMVISDYKKTHQGKLSINALPTYRTLNVQLKAFNNYKPSLSFYCQTTEGGGYGAILSILNTTLIRIYNNTAKQFSGTVYTNLENGSKIHYIVEGNFYDNGTTTVSGSGGIEVGGAFTLSYDVSYSTNYFGAIYEVGDVFWPRS